MLNAAVASIPYPFSAAKYAELQSRAARFILGDAAMSVRQSPSDPPAVAPLDVPMKAVPAVSTVTVIPFPARPIVRDVIVSTAPLALAQTPVDPALISSSRHFATVPAVSPIRLRCATTVPPSDTCVVFPNSGDPENVTVADAY